MVFVVDGFNVQVPIPTLVTVVLLKTNVPENVVEVFALPVSRLNVEVADPKVVAVPPANAPKNSVPPVLLLNPTVNVDVFSVANQPVTEVLPPDMRMVSLPVQVMVPP